MAVIFALSAMPSGDTDHGVLYLIARKIGHFSEYALLAVLWWRALRTRFATRTAITLAVAFSVAYAVTDELHQRSVENRVGTPIDVAIDTAGIFTAATLIAIRRRVPG